MHKLGKPLNRIRKLAFSRKLKTSTWNNASILKGQPAEKIKALKKQKGKDIIVYGGHSFVTSLPRHDLVDEFYLLVNPAALGNGQPIYNPLKNNSRLTLTKCKPFQCGTLLLYYSVNK